MLPKKWDSFRKTILFAFLLFTAGAFTACSQEPEAEIEELEIYENPSPKEKAADEADNETEGSAAFDNNIAETAQPDHMKEMFGEGCISDQTFEVTLSEYDGKVWFVPFAPSEDNPDFHMQIIQDGEVLTNICAYVPKWLSEEKFQSLDAVSFFDVNYDGNTDIVLITTYDNTSFAGIYYGDIDAYDHQKSFFFQEKLSENISGQVEPLSVPEIIHFLSDGTRNGEFHDYREAYKAVSRLCDLEDGEEQEYNLIYFDDDDIPELVAGKNGYYTSLYTYRNGSVYTLMDRWPYGAGGNHGYEYSEGKNSLRNYNTDYAGAILYTTYMAVRDQCTMDVFVQIVTYNFDDVNGNGVPDKDETESMGNYSVSYIDGVEVTPEECAVYDAGGYKDLEVNMSLEDLEAKLNGE